MVDQWVDQTEQVVLLACNVRCCHQNDEVHSLRCVPECYHVKRS